jgi:hypothetical protein
MKKVPGSSGRRWEFGIVFENKLFDRTPESGVQKST